MHAGGERLLLKNDSLTPIYVQIAEWLENEILSDHLQSDEKVYSQYQLAEMFNINPATAAKGIHLLAEENLLYKKRGLGMFVANHARELIRTKRVNHNLRQLAMELVAEAERLQVREEELIGLIQDVQLQARKGERP
jgi:GntR family transcriptional regulator